jgi:mRNA interferase MazF
MVISQGEVWWTDFGSPDGCGPAYARPAVVVQSDSFNRSRIGTIVCVPLTSSLQWADAPGNVPIDAASSCLDRDSVANVSQITTVDRRRLRDRVGVLPARTVEAILDGIGVVLGR